MRYHTATIYEIKYTTPRGAHKHVLWRGKTASHAVQSWMAIAAPGSTCTEVKDHKITWLQ